MPVIIAQYFQGANAATAVLAPGPVGVGMTFLAIQPAGTLFPPTSELGPLVNAGQYPIATYQVTSPFTLGTFYTVTAVIRDPMANPDDPGMHNPNIDDHVNDPGDTITLSGGIGTVSALVLAFTRRVA